MKISNIYTLLFLALLTACNKNISAPDIIVASEQGNALYIADHESNNLIILDSDNYSKTGKINFDTPISDIYINNGSIIVLTEGSTGSCVTIDSKTLTKTNTFNLGYNPSSIIYNKITDSYWTTQRFNQELWEVDQHSGEVKCKLSVGREPVDIVSFRDDSLMIVINNLPDQAANVTPISTKINIIDVTSKSEIKQLILPNGSTDAKCIILDNQKRFGYIPHTLSRYQLPTNQVDRGWMTTSVVTIVDLQNLEIVNTVILDTPQRGAANPWGGIVSLDDKFLFITLSGTHEVISIALNPLHDRLAQAKNGEKATPSTRSWSDVPNDAGFLYGIREFIPTKGKGTRSLTIKGDKLLGTNYFSAEVFKIDLKADFLSISYDNTESRHAILTHKPIQSTTVKLFDNPLIETAKGRGESYFHDATLSFQNWQSCASCHPNEARIDGLNWDLLNDGAGSLKQTKTLLYSHKTPPSMITGIRESAYKAVRSGFKFILFAQTEESICNDIDAYLISLEALPSPYLENGKLSKNALNGKPIFDRECIACHSGEYYTDMKLYPIDWATGKDKNINMDTPTLREIWRTAPYLYDGRAVTMKEMLNHHTPSLKLTADESRNLEEYILSL